MKFPFLLRIVLVLMIMLMFASDSFACWRPLQRFRERRAGASGCTSGSFSNTTTSTSGCGCPGR